jgi:hypothetical protein
VGETANAIRCAVTTVLSVWLSTWKQPPQARASFEASQVEASARAPTATSGEEEKRMISSSLK